MKIRMLETKTAAVDPVGIVVATLQEGEDYDLEAPSQAPAEIQPKRRAAKTKPE